MRSLGFSVGLILPATLWPLESTQPRTEVSTRNLPGGKGGSSAWGWQPHRHLWANCLENVGAFMSQNPVGLYNLLQGQLYFFSLVKAVTVVVSTIKLAQSLMFPFESWRVQASWMRFLLGFLSLSIHAGIVRQTWPWLLLHPFSNSLWTYHSSTYCSSSQLALHSSSLWQHH
jgi:hypothetical protein